MSQTVRGVISRKKGEPVEVVDVVIPDPGPGEVVVDILACGVCHTDLTYREGGINDEYPFLLGHEAAGTVESIGAGVTNVEPGDFVILNWRAVCGQCRACKRGRPHLLLRHVQRRAEDDADRRHRADPGAGHRGVRRQDAGARGPVHQGRSRGRSRRGRAAGLRRDGRHRRGDQHRRGQPRRHRRGDRLRRSGRRRHRRRPAGRRQADHRRRHRQQEAGLGARVRRHPHHQRPRARSGGDHPGPHRRQRRRRRDRRGRPARRPGSRRSTPAIWREPLCWLVFRRRT